MWCRLEANHKRVKSCDRAYRVFRLYVVDWRNFLGCVRASTLKLQFAKYELFSRHTLTYFFRSPQILLADIGIGERTIEEEIQYRRVREVLKFYPALPPRKEIDGRDSSRIYELIDSRVNR